MILALGEALMEFRRSTDDGSLTAPGEWAGPFPSGAPAIFASVAARLGGRVALAAAVGDDQFGHAVHTRLGRDGVLLDALHVAPGRATATAFVAYDRTGGRDFWFSVHDSAAMALDRHALERLWPDVDWLHVSGSTIGFGGALAEAVLASVEHVAAAGGRISVDPNLRADADARTRAQMANIARAASVLFPSAGELEGLGLSERSLVADGAVVCHTRGAHGATVVAADLEAPVPVSAPAAREVDPTGAGDTFAAAFVSAIRQGTDPVAAARFACHTASRTVEVLGAMEAPIEPAFAAGS
jgi:sugar/nucleoside kinase (ribokinase family)